MFGIVFALFHIMKENFNENKHIEMITNVYLQNYSNAKGGGIGDFFRVSFFLLQFFIKNN